MVVDGLDAVAVGEAVTRAEPEVVIHQMTALGAGFDLRHPDRTFAKTNELRTRGLDHLLAAAAAAGARRVIAQLDAIRYLEHAVLTSPLEGIVLRYGNLYGPGASDPFVVMIKRRQVSVIGNGAGIWPWVHVQDAASAAVAALDRGDDIYNIADDEPAAVRAWLPALAAAVGARKPFRVPVWLGRFAAGETAVVMMTQVPGSSNASPKRELGWAPAWPSWRDGFTRGLHAVLGQVQASRP